MKNKKKLSINTSEELDKIINKMNEITEDYDATFLFLSDNSIYSYNYYDDSDWTDPETCVDLFNTSLEEEKPIYCVNYNDYAFYFVGDLKTDLMTLFNKELAAMNEKYLKEHKKELEDELEKIQKREKEIKDKLSGKNGKRI